MSMEAKSKAYWQQVEKTGMAYEWQPETLVRGAYVDGHKAGVESVQAELQLLRDQAHQSNRQCKQLREELAAALTMFKRMRGKGF